MACCSPGALGNCLADRGGSLNLNIRYGQMTMALVAQALLHQLRQLYGFKLDFRFR